MAISVHIQVSLIDGVEKDGSCTFNFVAQIPAKECLTCYYDFKEEMAFFLPRLMVLMPYQSFSEIQSLNSTVTKSTIYMKNFPNLGLMRAAQYEGYTAQKKGNINSHKFTFFGPVLLISCILLIDNSVVSRATWKNTHS